MEGKESVEREREKARGNLVGIGRGEFDRILLAKYLDRHIIPSLNY